MACLKQKSKVYGILRMNPGTDQLGICFYYKKSRSIQKNIVFGKALLSPCPFSRLSEVLKTAALFCPFVKLFLRFSHKEKYPVPFLVQGILPLILS